MSDPRMTADKKAFWRFRHAMQCFEYARSTSDMVLAQQWPTDHPLIYQMSISVVVLYSRPFTDCYGLGILPDSVIPEVYHSKHKRLMAMRHKVFAHYDITDFDDPSIADLKPKVRLNLSANGTVIELFETPLLPEAFRQVKEMCLVLEEKCRWHLTKIGDRYSKLFPKADGIYDLDLDNSNEFFSKPA